MPTVYQVTSLLTLCVALSSLLTLQYPYCQPFLKPHHKVVAFFTVLSIVVSATCIQGFEDLYEFLEASPHRHAKLESVITEPHSRKVSRRSYENQHIMVSNEETFRVTIFYELLDVMISEFERLFNQESRQFFTLLCILNTLKSKKFLVGGHAPGSP